MTNGLSHCHVASWNTSVELETVDDSIRVSHQICHFFGFIGRQIENLYTAGGDLHGMIMPQPIPIVETIPQLASAGLSEQSPREKALKFQTHREITSSWYSSRRVAKVAQGLRS
jgi:hypothetical protein